MQINSAKDLDVYKKAYKLSLAIFDLSGQWPKDETYSLTSQIRRSSRSVCANLREAWAKRRYKGHFVSKLSDCDAENSETDTWLDYAHECGYLNTENYTKMVQESREVGKMLGAMLKKPSPFLLKSSHS